MTEQPGYNACAVCEYARICTERAKNTYTSLLCPLVLKDLKKSFSKKELGELEKRLGNGAMQ